MNPRNFFAELKRRNVYRAAVAYGVVAWFLTQLTTQVFPFFEIPKLGGTRPPKGVFRFKNWTEFNEWKMSCRTRARPVLSRGGEGC